MGSTINQVGGRVRVMYFSDSLHKPSRAQLVAAVVQRRDASLVHLPRTSLWSFLRSLVRPRPTADATPSWRPPDGWSGGADSDGTHEVLYHSQLRLVRVAGREFELPSDGRAMILLVNDERARPGEGPDITVRSIDAPVIPQLNVDPRLNHVANLKRTLASSREQHDAWRRALHTDPVTHDFLQASE